MGFFQPEWLRLLIAKSEQDGTTHPINATYTFPVLVKAIKYFAAKAIAGSQEEALLRIPNQKIGKFKLNYSQIVGATNPWEKDRARTWHDGLPKHLLFLVANNPTETEIDNVQITEAQWDDIAKLLEFLRRKINEEGDSSDWKNWKPYLTANITILGNPVGGYLQSWVTLDCDESAKPGSWLLPGFSYSASHISAKLELPGELTIEVGKKATAYIDDPRTLLGLGSTPNIEFKATNVDCEIAVPLLLEPELNWAVKQLQAIVLPGKGNIWDEALTVDPDSSQDINLVSDEFSNRVNTLKKRLKEPANNFSSNDLDIIVAACWARRLRQIAYKGLAYLEGKFPKKIEPIVDDESNGTIDTLTAVFYLALRQGSASSSSARTLTLNSKDDGSVIGVADLLTPAALVYVEAAKQIGQFIDSDASETRKKIMSNRPQNAPDGRATIEINVFELVKIHALALKESKDRERKIAEIEVTTDKENLSDKATQQSAIIALKQTFENPPLGGLAGFITNFRNKLTPIALDESISSDELALHIEANPSLEVLLKKGFRKDLAKQLTTAAKDLDIPITAFFKLVVASTVKFMPLFLMAHPRVAGSN